VTQGRIAIDLIAVSPANLGFGEVITLNQVV
jgi:hypothetical protein